MDEMKELQLESHQASPLCRSFWMVLVQKMDHLYPFVVWGFWGLFGAFVELLGYVGILARVETQCHSGFIQELCLKMWTQVKFAANLSVKK